MSESPLVRLFYRIRLQRHGDPLSSTAPCWKPAWSPPCVPGPRESPRPPRERYGAEAGTALASNWAEAFPAGYRVEFEVEEALADIERFGVYEEPTTSVRSSSSTCPRKTRIPRSTPG